MRLVDNWLSDYITQPDTIKIDLITFSWSINVSDFSHRRPHPVR